MIPLKQVDKLTIQFLVDNTTEWYHQHSHLVVRTLTLDFIRFLKMPPGFTHELKYHLTELHPPIDPLTGVPVIDAENYCCGTLDVKRYHHSER